MSHAATLVYDSENGSAGSAVRGIFAGERSLWFEAAGLHVDLVVHPRSNHLRVIHGHVFDGATGQPYRKVRVTISKEEHCARTDDYGEFLLSTTRELEDQVLTVETATARLTCIFPALDDLSTEEMAAGGMAE